MSMKVNKITSKIIHLEFDDKYEMNSYLLRFQEYYESPKFRDRIFTLGEFRAWYTEKNGDFNYYEDVEGMNFPKKTLEPFLNGLFDPLTVQEKEVLDRIGKSCNDFYIIATYVDGDTDTYEHEICHALFGTNEKYKNQILRVLEKYDHKKIKKWLKKHEYNDEVMDDEIHAYVICNTAYLQENGIVLDDKMVSELKKIRRRFKPKTIY